MKYMISACLLGIKCRYDGRSNPCQEIIDLFKKEGGIVVCPEQLGGLPTPRPPVTIIGGDGKDVLEGKARCINNNGIDVTRKFLLGAEMCLLLASMAHVKIGYLKGSSPSCGFKTTNIEWEKREGLGVTSALLQKMGIKIIEI